MRKLIILLCTFTIFFLVGCENKTTLKEGHYYDKNNIHDEESLEWIFIKDSNRVERTKCEVNSACTLFKGTYVIEEKTLKITLTEYSEEVDNWTGLEKEEKLEYTITANNKFMNDQSSFILDPNKTPDVVKHDITLTKINETFNLDKLNLEFAGIDSGECDECYLYTLNIKYAGKDVGKGFFNDKDNFRIFSSNMAAKFIVYQIDDVYIVVSSIDSQCHGENILIFNAEGKTLQMFSNADTKIKTKEIHIEVSPSGACTDNPEIVRDYKIKGLELIKK